MADKQSRRIINQTQKAYETRVAVAEYDREYLKETEKIVFKKYFAKKGAVLDIGCGTGRTSIFLAKAGHRVVAMDYSEAMIMRAVEKHKLNNLQFGVMDASALPIRDKVFDYVLFSYNGIDHLYPKSARIKVLREVYRVLKPGGVFAFSAHNSWFIPNNPSRIWRFVKSVVQGKLHPYRFDYFEFGRTIMHFISPMAQIKELEKEGFVRTKVISTYGQHLGKIALTDPYPTYLGRKPL